MEDLALAIFPLMEILRLVTNLEPDPHTQLFQRSQESSEPVRSFLFTQYDSCPGTESLSNASKMGGGMLYCIA